MNSKYIAIITLLLTALPFSASAQGSGLYAVAEIGTVQNSMILRGDLAGLPNENNSAASFGVSLGYRSFVSNNFVVGLEGNIASSSSNSSVSDDFDTISFDENMVAGVYLTGGFALGDDRRALVYGLIGVGSVNADTSIAGLSPGSTSIEDSGSGISFGGAVEYAFTDSLGIRAKVLHTRYKGDLDELKIRDTSIMGGLVYSF